jgi:hypothetical protein
MHLLQSLRQQVAKSLDDYVVLNEDGREIEDTFESWSRTEWWQAFQALVRCPTHE